MVQTQSSPWHESGSIPSNGAHTILCFSHLRWKFVFQRPQHLMSRFAAQSRVLFWEEPCLVAGLPEPDVHIDVCATRGVIVITPQLPRSEENTSELQSIMRISYDS